MSEWEVRNWRDSQPVVKRVNQLFNNASEWFLYLRLNRNFKCARCYEEPQLSPPARACPDCLGTGYVVTPELIQGRIHSGGPVGEREGLMLKDPGYVFQGGETLYFPRQLAPKELDIVCQCEYNVPTKEIGTNPRARPLSYTSIYLVKIVYYPTQRESGFVICGAEPYSNDQFTFESFLPQMNNFRKHVLSPVYPTNYWPG